MDRSNKPPVWDNLERISRAVYVKENTAVGETVTTVRARSQQILMQKKTKEAKLLSHPNIFESWKEATFF